MGKQIGMSNGVSSRRRLVPAVALAGLLLAACEGNGGPSATPPPTATASPPYGGTRWLGPHGLEMTDPDYFQDAAQLHMPTAIGRVRGGVVYGTTTGDVYHQPFDGTPVQVGRNSRLGPVGDPLSGTAAWFERDELVVYDCLAGKVLSRVAVSDKPDWPPDPLLFRGHPILVVSPRLVTFEAGGRVWEHHRFAAKPVETQRSARILIDTAAGVDAVAGPMRRDRATGARSLTRVKFVADGRLLWRTRPLFAEGRFSADGRYFAASTGYDKGHRLVVFDVRAGRSVDLDHEEAFDLMPAPSPYKWSFEDVLLVLAADPGRKGAIPSWQVSCDMSAGRCAPSPEALRWELLPAG